MKGVERPQAEAAFGLPLTAISVRLSHTHTGTHTQAHTDTGSFRGKRQAALNQGSLREIVVN